MARPQFIARLLVLLALLGLNTSSLAFDPEAGQPPPLPGICSESDRFGVAVAGWIGGYDVAQLHAGWYHNFATSLSPPHPAGMKYIQTIRLSDDGPFADKACSACPTWVTLEALIQANPSSLWIIGNEQDRQDYVGAARYAELYHEFYAFLKAEDPTSQVGIGGVVQTTPVRLQYLDLVLDAYQDQYGKKMPVDVWNVHNYVLREKRWYPGCPDCWGCSIPPDIPSDTGRLYKLEEHDDMGWWTDHLVQMRKWMSDRGYRNRPLIITEFGILMPEIYGYDYARVQSFMLQTFDWMLTATDPDTGYPADGNRLVQAWAWYSLNDPAFEGYTSWNHLFNPSTMSITALGRQFAAYTAPLTDPFPGSIDLRPTSIWHTPPQPPGGDPVTMRVKAEIHNDGSITADNVVVRFERDGVPAGETTIASIPAGKSRVASVVWSDVPRGQLYQVTVIVDPDAQFVECDPFNNRLSVPMLVTDLSVHLPVIQKSR